MTAEHHDGTDAPLPPEQAPRAPVAPQAVPLPVQRATESEHPPVAPAPGAYAASPPPLGLSSLLPHIMAVTGFFAIMIAMFAPLASNGDPATSLRTVDLPFLTPILGLVVLVFATAAMCRDPRFLGFGRAVTPLLGLLLSAAVGAEIFQWGAQVPDPRALADMVSAGTYFLIGGILLLSCSVLPMRPAAGRTDPAGR